MHSIKDASVETLCENTVLKRAHAQCFGTITINSHLFRNIKTVGLITHGLPQDRASSKGVLPAQSLRNA